MREQQRSQGCCRSGGDGAACFRPPALPRPFNGFIRAVSHNRKRVHEASARLFCSQESPLSGNSEERLELGSGGRGAGEATAAPWARGWQDPGSSRAGKPWRQGVPGSSLPPPSPPVPPPPHSRGLMMETPRWRFPAPWEGASFRGRLRVPSTSPPAAARRPSPHGAACALAARGSPRHVSVQAGAGRTCLGVFGSPRGLARLVERKGQAESRVCVEAWVGRGLFAAPACVCVCCFLLYGDILGG